MNKRQVEIQKPTVEEAGREVTTVVEVQVVPLFLAVLTLERNPHLNLVTQRIQSHTTQRERMQQIQQTQKTQRTQRILPQVMQSTLISQISWQSRNKRATQTDTLISATNQQSSTTWKLVKTKIDSQSAVISWPGWQLQGTSTDTISSETTLAEVAKLRFNWQGSTITTMVHNNTQNLTMALATPKTNHSSVLMKENNAHVMEEFTTV